MGAVTGPHGYPERVISPSQEQDSSGVPRAAPALGIRHLPGDGLMSSWEVSHSLGSESVHAESMVKLQRIRSSESGRGQAAKV